MTLKLNKQYDLFMEVAEWVYDKVKSGNTEFFDYPNYMGMKKAGNLSPACVDAIQDASEHMKYGTWGNLTKRSFMEACVMECFRSSFYDEFVCKNQKLN